MSEELSVLDVVEQSSDENGLLLKTEPVSAQGISFHPDEGEVESAKAEPGKSIRRLSRLLYFKKKALGLTDVPRSAVPGATPPNGLVEESGYAYSGSGPTEGDLDRNFLTTKDDADNSDAWPKQSGSKDSSINNDDKKEDFFKFINSENDEVLTENQKNIQTLASALESLGYKREAAEIRKVAAVPLIPVLIGLAAVAAGGAVYYNEYDRSNLDEDAVAAIDTVTSQAVALREAVNEAESGFFGDWEADLDADMFESVMIQVAYGEPTEVAFEPLYKEVAEVLADQDVDKLDPHFFGYGDEGDFGSFPGFVSWMVSNFAGKKVTASELKKAIQKKFSANIHEFGVGNLNSDSMLDMLSKYVGVWNALVVFEEGVKGLAKTLEQSPESEPQARADIEELPTDKPSLIEFERRVEQKQQLPSLIEFERR
jgi:hypothetical protein